MICITDIRDKGKSLFYYEADAYAFLSFISGRLVKGSAAEFFSIGFDLFNTDTNVEMKNLSIKDISGFYKNIFGVFLYEDKILFYVMDKDTWHLLDFIDGVKYFDYYESFNSFIEKTGINVINHGNNYVVASNNVVVVYSDSYEDFRPLDEDLIFWYYSSAMHFTVFDLYLKIFKTDGVVITADSDVYFYCRKRGVMYKFDINKQVIRFMAKCITLNR